MEWINCLFLDPYTRPRIFWEPGVHLLILGSQNSMLSAKLWWYQNTDESPNFSFLKVGLEKLGKKLHSWGRRRHPQPVGLISGSNSLQLQRPPWVNVLQSCGGFPLACLLMLWETAPFWESFHLRQIKDLQRWRHWIVSLLQADYSFTGDSTQGSCPASLLTAWWRLLKRHRPLS